MKRKSYTQDQVNRIIRLRINGWHPKDIARIECRSESEINRLLSMEKKNRHLPYPKLVKSDTQWTAERIEYELVRKCTDGYKQLAIMIGISQPRVSFLMAKRAYMVQAGEWMY